MTRTLLAALLCAVVLAGCGRVGHPVRRVPAPVAEPAPEAEADEQEEEEQP